MRHNLARLAAWALCFLAVSGVARGQCPTTHVITVNGSEQVLARPDLGILILDLESSAPLAADAVRENASKASEVESALKALGYSGDASQVTPVIFTRAGGAYYGPNQPSVTGIQAQQFIYVFFASDQLKNLSQLSQKAAAVIDALTKSGAAAANPYPRQQAAMVVYTVKNPAEYERQAVQKAIARARDTAQAMAKSMGVEITGLHSASTGFIGGAVAGGMIGPYPQTPANALQELPYRFYSARGDQVAITANATLTYDFK